MARSLREQKLANLYDLSVTSASLTTSLTLNFNYNFLSLGSSTFGHVGYYITTTSASPTTETIHLIGSTILFPVGGTSASVSAQVDTSFLASGQTYYVWAAIGDADAEADITPSNDVRFAGSFVAPSSGNDAGNTFGAATSITLPYTSSNGSVGVGSDTDDYFRFTATVSGTITVDLTGLSSDIDLYAYNASQSIIASSTLSGASSETMTLSVVAGQTYYLHVDPFLTASSSYVFNARYNGSQNQAPSIGGGATGTIATGNSIRGDVFFQQLGVTWSDSDGQVVSLRLNDAIVAQGNFVYNGSSLAGTANVVISVANLHLLYYVAGTTAGSNTFSVEAIDNQGAVSAEHFVTVNVSAFDDGDNIVTLTAAGTYFAQGGHDRVTGTSGADTIYGEVGNDVLLGMGGMDTLVGGTDNDYLAGGDAADTLSGEAGIDNLNGDAGDDTLYGGTERDFLYGGSGLDTVYGADGDDIIDGTNDTSGVGDVAYGGNGQDFIYGTIGSDTLHGEGGFDNITGGDAGDTIYGGAELDFLYGQGGTDTVSGGSEQDFVYGGDAGDTLSGDAGDDFVYGEAGVDTLYGGIGGDYLYGGAGNDTIVGGDGNDFVLSTGEADGDTAFGDGGTDYFITGDGGDYLVGAADNDVFLSAGGSDTLIGGGGQDYMWSGSGTDKVVYTGVATAGYDVVYDFADGVDRIGLSSGFTYASLVASGRIGYDAVNNNTFVFDTGATSSGIILLGFNRANLTDADFVPFA